MSGCNRRRISAKTTEVRRIAGMVDAWARVAVENVTAEAPMCIVEHARSPVAGGHGGHRYRSWAFAKRLGAGCVRPNPES